MPTPDPQLRTCIDSPQPGETSLHAVVLQGWCFCAGARRVTGLRAVNAADSQPARLGMDRHDVAAAFNEPGAARCGFRVALRLPPGESETRLVATLDDGSAHEAATLRLRAPRRLVATEWIHDFLLRRCGPLPRRLAWRLLSPEQRDFLLARADQHGTLSIGRDVQHAPRPVEAETFPAPSARSPAELPRIDIAMPSFNQGAYIGAAVRSVLSQEGVRLRLHVQDAASNDGTAAALAALAGEFPSTPGRQLSLDSRPDGGQADAINTAFARLGDATPHDVMAYLNSDDILLPGALRFVAEWFAAHPRIDAVYGQRLILDEQGLQTGRWFTPRPACDDLRLQDLVPQECLFWRRRAWDRLGGLDPAFRFALDWDFLQRLGAARLRLVRLPWFLAGFRRHPAQKTQAWMQDHGTPEMDRLRARACGGPVPRERFLRSMTLGQFDSSLVAEAWQRGQRL